MRSNMGEPRRARRVRSPRLITIPLVVLVACVVAITSAGLVTYSGAAAVADDPADTATATQVSAVSDLLNRKDFIYGSEIGAWRTTGRPATDPSTGIPALVQAAKVPVIRYSIYDVFTDMTDPLGNPGTQSRANFDAALNSIRSNLHAEVMLKLLPISKDIIGSKDGAIYCPPLDDLTQNLYYYKQLVAQAGSRVRIYESTNEMEYVCAKAWGFSSAGSPGVSKALGEHFAQNMPALKKYARSLGIDIVTVGYIGTAGGFGWGDSIAKPRISTATEFLSATHDAFVASGYDPDFIPDAISIHAYPNSPDFGFDASLADIIAYHESWKAKVQDQMNTIWGPTIGPNIKMAISEWNAGSKVWKGFSDDRVVDFYRAWLDMLQRDGYWLANQFAIASNGTEPYDMIKENGTTTSFYTTFKAASTAATCTEASGSCQPDPSANDPVPELPEPDVGTDTTRPEECLRCPPRRRLGHPHR